MILWIYSTIGALLSISLGIEVYFRPVIASCDINYVSNPTVAVAGVIIQYLLPFTFIVLINIAMYIIAKHRFKDLSNNRALMTVASVSGLFAVSWLPSILVILLGVQDISTKSLVWLDKIQINFYFLSVFGNPLLYSFVHRGFGKFARGKFSIFLRKCQNSVEAQWANSVSKSSEHAAELAPVVAKGKQEGEEGKVLDITPEEPQNGESSKDSGLCCSSS